MSLLLCHFGDLDGATANYAEGTRARQPGGPPNALRTDNDHELVSQALQRFSENRVGLSCIPPNTPWNNGDIESFNNGLRKERLNRNHWSGGFREAFEGETVDFDWVHADQDGYDFRATTARPCGRQAHSLGGRSTSAAGRIGI
jgi:transposase InsO family protein